MTEDRRNYAHSTLEMALKISLWNVVLNYEGQDRALQEVLLRGDPDVIGGNAML